jgi:hypothetical protein
LYKFQDVAAVAVAVGVKVLVAVSVAVEVLVAVPVGVGRGLRSGAGEELPPLQPERALATETRMTSGK